MIVTLYEGNPRHHFGERRYYAGDDAMRLTLMRLIGKEVINDVHVGALRALGVEVEIQEWQS